MYTCDDSENCNTMREPTCLRGGPVTASSVTGTGPGGACDKEPPTPPLPSLPPKRTCRVHVVGQSRRSYLTGGNTNIQVC